MKKRKDIIDKAINHLKNEPIPPGPPQELINTTLAKLTNASGKSQATDSRPIKFATKSFMKVAAATALLIITSYSVGRLSSPRAANVEQLQAALAPALRRKVTQELNDQLLLALASNNAQLKQEFRDNLNEVAVRTLTASSAVTNQLLEELIEAINTANTEERRWVAAALEQIELNRLRDKAQWSNAMVTLAVQTEDNLRRTKQDVVKWISDSYPRVPIPNESKSPNSLNERSKK